MVCTEMLIVIEEQLIAKSCQTLMMFVYCYM